MTALRPMINYSVIFKQNCYPATTAKLYLVTFKRFLFTIKLKIYIKLQFDKQNKAIEYITSTKPTNDIVVLERPKESYYISKHNKHCLMTYIHEKSG